MMINVSLYEWNNKEIIKFYLFVFLDFLINDLKYGVIVLLI